MIKITIVKESENLITIEATGHSGYAESGSDIICSAVSTLTQNCEKALSEMLKIKHEFVIDEKTPYILINLSYELDKKSMHDAQIIMKSTYMGLKDLANSYPKFINIKEKRK